MRNRIIETYVAYGFNKDFRPVAIFADGTQLQHKVPMTEPQAERICTLLNKGSELTRCHWEEIEPKYGTPRYDDIRLNGW